MNRGIIVILIVCVSVWLAAPLPVRAAERNASFATYLDWGAETDAQFVFFLSALFNYMSNEISVKEAKYKHYTSREEFYKKFVNGHGPRFVIVGNRGDMVELIRDHGFKPVIAYDVVGLKQNKICIYARKESGLKTLKSMRGKSIGMNQGPFAYCLLKDILGARPDKYFSMIEETTTGLEAVYMLSLKESDGIFVTDQIVGFLKQNNPGAVHGLEKISCSPNYMFLPLLAKDAPDDLVAQFLPLLKKVETGKALSEHYGIIKIQKLKFKSVGPKDFSWDIDFFTRAQKSGCVDEYNAWKVKMEKED